jgi:hypothetical protein
VVLSGRITLGKIRRSLRNNPLTFCRRKLDVLVEKAANVPLLGLLGAFLKDWMPLIDEYYYCEFSPYSLNAHILTILL